MLEVRGPTPRPNSTTNTWTAGTWYHAAVTLDAAGYKVFINGVQQGSSPNTFSILDNANQLVLGWDAVSSHTPFNGLIDETTLYNRALSAQEIQAIYHAGSAGKCKEGLNHPPVITSTPVTTATVGQPYTYDVEASDPDAGDTPTFSLVEKPEGMTINATTGLIEWTPSPTNLLFSIDATTDQLVTIDPLTGYVTVIGALGRDVVDTDLTFVNHDLYAVSTLFNQQKAELLKINETTGAATFLANLSSGGTPITHAEGLTSKDGKLFVSFTTNGGDTNSRRFGELALTGEISNDTPEMSDADGLGTSSSGVFYFIDREAPTNILGTVRPTKTLVLLC